MDLCFIDPRDSRPTYLAYPKSEEFKMLVESAWVDPLYKVPYRARRIFTVGGIPGLADERWQTSESFGPPNKQISLTQTRSIENDYTLYEKLDPRSKDIRLAYIQPALPDAPIRCHLVKFAAPWKERDYVALSYCWGDLDEIRRVHLGHVENLSQPDVVCRDQWFSTTANLEMGLRRFRREKKPGWIWIDALQSYGIF